MSIGYSGSLPLSLRREPFTLNDRRGSLAILLFIATEAALFAMLFATYWYMGKGQFRWPPDKPPKLHYAIPMLIVLLASSVVLHWGELQVKKHKVRTGKIALAVTILMGIGFLVMSVFEYKEHLAELLPTRDAYASILYTTVTLHAAHVVVGLCVLSYVLLLPSIEPRQSTPHRPYHNASLYWHFVDTVWVFVVLFYYVVPNIRR